MQSVHSLNKVFIVLALVFALFSCSSKNDLSDPLDDNINAPGVPMQLVGKVYSAHEIELFWQAATDDGWVIGYDVYRDGVLLSEQLAARSYFDATLQANTEYTYTLYAVDDDGNRSDPVSVTLMTPAIAAQPQINRDNYSELLSHIFSIYAGDIYNEPLITLSDFVIEGRNPDGSFFDVHECVSGDFSQYLEPSGTLSGTGYQFDFESCFENGVTYNGTLSGRNSGYAESLNFEKGFSLQVHPELKTSFFGSGVFSTSLSRSDTLHQWEAVGVSVDSNTINGALNLDSVTTLFGYGSTGGGIFRSWLNGGFNVRSEITAGALLVVSTPVEMSYECDPNAATPCTFELPHRWAFTSGQLEVKAEDGSMLFLDADTPSQETLNITINNDLGTQTILAQWSEWEPELSFDRFSADSADWVSAQSLAYADLDIIPAIRPDNYVALLDHVFESLTGYHAYNALRGAQSFLENSSSSQTTRTSGVRVDQYTCGTVGSATAHRVDNDTSIYPLDYRLGFEQCDYEGYQYDGDIRGQEVRALGGASYINSTSLQWIDGSARNYAFLGTSLINRTDDADKTVCNWDAEKFSLHAQTGSLAESVVTGTLSVRAQRSADTGKSIVMSGDIQMMSEITEGFEIAVSVSELEFLMSTATDPNSWKLVNGEISIQAYDKSFRWSADRSMLSYNVADATIEIVNSDGSYFIATPWTSWQASANSALDRLCGEP